MRTISFSVFLFLSNLTFGFSLFNDTTQWDITDSIINLPRYDEYCHFDHKDIWGKRKDLTKIHAPLKLNVIEDSCQFHAPLIGRLTSNYGWRKGKPHYGVDLKLAKGDSIKSVFEGVVRISQYSRSYGYVVVVRHHNGLETLYAHLSKLKVKEGEVINAGTLVGLGGNTGHSFGSHLHFEVRYLGEPFNPSELFAITDSTFKVKAEALELKKESFALAKKARSIQYHRVRRGDSLWKISRRYGVSIKKLCRLNKMSRKTPLRIGQRLRYR